ncbi:DMT family transporter [Bradyrhizobium erythrophlei]|uniref:DMT family transporter n=1 Tax=Bradyrhizobium erythrophlei TaxID=1437360 RepID=UPI0035E989DC
MRSDSSEHGALLRRILKVSSRGATVNTQASATSFNAAPSGRNQFNLALDISLMMLLSLIWGSSFTLIKVAIETIPPLTMTATRATIAALLLVLIARMSGLSLPRDRETWAAFLIQGLLQSALPFTLINWGEKHIASGLAGVLNATPPIFALLITLVTRRNVQRIPVQKTIGVGAGFIGVLVTVGFQSLRDIDTTAPLAQIAVLVASLCYALAPMWGQRFSSLPAIVTAAGAMSGAAILMLPVAVIIERPWTLSLTPEAALSVIVLAILCTAIAMIIYFRLIRTLGPLGTTSGSYLRAGFAVALGSLFLGEDFTWSMIAGMVLIILGVVAVTAPLRSPWSKG